MRNKQCRDNTANVNVHLLAVVDVHVVLDCRCLEQVLVIHVRDETRLVETDQGVFRGCAVHESTREERAISDGTGRSLRTCGECFKFLGKWEEGGDGVVEACDVFDFGSVEEIEGGDEVVGAVGVVWTADDHETETFHVCSREAVLCENAEEWEKAAQEESLHEGVLGLLVCRGNFETRADGWC